MRTAEERMTEKFPNAVTQDWFIPISECIKAAQIDAILKCAENVKLSQMPCGDIKICGCEICQYPIYVCDKQSILKLIDQVK